MRVGIVRILPAVDAAASRIRDNTLLCADISFIVRDCLLESCGIILGIPVPYVG